MPFAALFQSGPHLPLHLVELRRLSVIDERLG